MHEQRDITLAAGEKAAPVSFTARPGARVSGRVLTPEGAPAVGVQVWAKAIIYVPFETSATDGYGWTTDDGTYHIAGLAYGTYTINAGGEKQALAEGIYTMSAGSEKQAWVVEPLKEITLVEGKATVIPDLRAHAGAVLDGTVVDAESGMPLAYAYLALSYGTAFNPQQSISLRADKFGHFHYRTLPATVKLLFEGHPDGYLEQQASDAQTVDLQEGKTVTVTVRVHKGLSVTGTVVDEHGKPVDGANFYIAMPDDKGVGFTTDQNGHFQAVGLSAGEGTLTLNSDYSQVNVWELPTPLAIAVPSKGPILVKVTRAATRTVSGRVLDTRQQPLAGVTATFKVNLNPPSYGSWPQTAVTHADGSYQLANIPTSATVSLISLAKAGYRQPITDTLTNAGTDTIGDAVMSACTAVVHGKVCDIDGKPVPGATVVSAEGGLTARATTDAAGAFTLAEQPEGQLLHLVAATPTGGGVATCKENEPAVITCTPATVANPTDLPLALKLLDADSKLPEQQRQFNRNETLREIADLNFALVDKLALAGNEPISEGLRAYLLGKQAEIAPAKVELAQLNLLRDSTCKLYAAVEVGIAVAQTDPGLAEQLYQIAKPIYDETMRGEPSGFYRQIDDLGSVGIISLRTLALAALLQKTADVDAMLAELHMLTSKEDNSQSNMIDEPLIEAAGQVSPEFASRIYDSIDDPLKGSYFWMVAASMAPHNPDGALEMLNMIERQSTDGFRLDHVLMVVIDALGNKDPAAALALAKAQPVDQQAKALLAAAVFQPKAMAGAILQEVFSEERNRTVANLAKANAIDPDFAKELYMRYKSNLEAESYNFTHRYNGLSTPNRLQYAYLISSIDPVEARLIIETEYADALSKFQHGGQSEELQFSSMVMSALDLDRAQAMIKAINVNGRVFGPSPQQQLMRYILMPREERVSEIF